MAGDWLQIDHDLPDKPEVIEMASVLAIDRFAVAGRLIPLWAWFDTHTTDGRASSRLRAHLDALCAQEGFVKAMEEVGWMSDFDGVLRVTKFTTRIGKSAKKRALAARRASRSRHARSATKSAPREEKRREEERREDLKEEIPPKVPQGGRAASNFGYSKSFEDWWKEYPRKEGKKLANKAWIQAGKELRAAGATSEQAVERLLATCKEFASSRKAAGDFCPHPATWLNGGRYDDDPACWDRQPSSQKTNPALFLKQSDDAP